MSGSAGSSGCSRLAQSGHPVRRAGAFRLGSAGLGTSGVGLHRDRGQRCPQPDNPCLAHFDPADAGLPARITVYRWALELRAGSPVMLYALIGDVLAEQAAAFLAIDPALLDAKYPRA